MKLKSSDFRVEEGHKVNLDKWPTAVEPIYESKKQYQKILANHVDQLSSLQRFCQHFRQVADTSRRGVRCCSF